MAKWINLNVGFGLTEILYFRRELNSCRESEIRLILEEDVLFLI